MNKHVLAIFLALFTFFSCKKAPVVTEPDPLFEIFVNNEYSELNARFALFASDQNTGEVLAFSWIPSEDTLVFQVPRSNPSDRFDFTIAKVTTLIAPGSGVRDTLVALTTYTDMGSGERINLRSPVYQQGSSLKFNLTGMNSLDSVVVSDAYAITRPTPANNYSGEYFCYHTGKCWLRILVDGDPFWRFVRFDNVNSPVVEANTLDAHLFLPILSPPLKLTFPFLSDWDFKVDGVVDTSKLEFFPLSRQLLAPGSFIPLIENIDIFEPVNNDQFDPNRPYDGLRVQARAKEPVANGYTYITDHFYDVAPVTLPQPGFDLEPTLLSDKRLIAVNCLGDFDLLSFSREHSAYHVYLTVKWEVITKPRSGLVSYRLPDVPGVLGDLYPPLKNYDFNPGVRARAESYESGVSYEKLVRNILNAHDPLWQAKAGYLGREESF